MKKTGLIIFSLLALSFGINRVQAQQAGGSFLISAGLDLVRSDLNQVMERAQFGAEVNYFYLHHLSFSGGYEYNLTRPNQVTGGIRWYPLEPVFIRARALIGNKADIGVGLGYTYNFTYRMRLESMVDYYVQEKALGARVAIAVLIN
ncbi:hypothetical protein [Cyclobacterium jeungdonense]|uniref:Outer membrane protein beta-barrel domain-containing protein n=1 Tax=Cyclobacterium jeungdonense TaxID=708087 RepID=A0ABT8CC43_9BACT|nr:hypothetical protein [Cyclobacterium jeungdonense]MDN3689737.1 hypothetical protein [Cyclobacterium jeungdonense]